MKKFIFILILLFYNNANSEYCPKGYEFGNIKNIGFCMPHNSTIYKNDFLEFSEYYIKHENKKIRIEIGSRHYGHLEYAYGNVFDTVDLKKLLHEETKIPVKLKKWKLEGGKYFFATEFSNNFGNILITYNSYDERSSDVGEIFFQSLFQINGNQLENIGVSTELSHRQPHPNHHHKQTGQHCEHKTPRLHP